LAGCGYPPRSELVETSGTQDATTLPVRAPVVLLGEQHDRAADHQWQLAVIRALYADDPSMVLGFEMFPRSAQPVLNTWVAGQLTEGAFLKQTDWAHFWGFPPELYMPIFRFARDHRVPMLALNVSHHLVHLVARSGWAGVAVAAREGVGNPAPASHEYRATLREAMGAHGHAMPAGQLDHFIDAQLLWDRAMAEAIAAQRGRRVVALMGGGHVEKLQGVPRQLAALGVTGVVALLPPVAPAS
jgi:uncharacterized iron-regulated protein